MLGGISIKQLCSLYCFYIISFFFFYSLLLYYCVQVLWISFSAQSDFKLLGQNLSSIDIYLRKAFKVFDRWSFYISHYSTLLLVCFKYLNWYQSLASGLSSCQSRGKKIPKTMEEGFDVNKPPMSKGANYDYWKEGWLPSLNPLTLICGML